MVQSIDVVNNGGESIRVGTTGTIGSLMIRELESVNTSPKAQKHPSKTPPTKPVSVFCRSAMPKLQPGRNAANEASSSCRNCRSPEPSQKTTRNTQNLMFHGHRKTDHGIPLLGSDGGVRDTNCIRKKPDKKGSSSRSGSRSYIVEVVDVKCSNSDKMTSSPITNRLRKLSFTKLSQTL